VPISSTKTCGCPLAEHGVGRNPVKQALLRHLYGELGIKQMRAVKHALDPTWKLSPDVIFERAKNVSSEPRIPTPQRATEPPNYRATDASGSLRSFDEDDIRFVPGPIE
jgi:hypothetical protein